MKRIIEMIRKRFLGSRARGSARNDEEEGSLGEGAVAKGD